VHINQRLNRSTNEYWVFAVLVSSSLSNAEFCACSEVWSAGAKCSDVATNFLVTALAAPAFRPAS
jgi:hypothetical protein